MAASALHAKSGNNHLFGVGNLQVIISECNGGFFAQGVEIDYFACGDSLEDVQHRFANGLRATIQEHLRRFQHFEKLLKWAPSDIREEMQRKYDSENYSLTQLTTCVIETNQTPIQCTYYREELKQAA